ncbi:MAG: hypothetical protein HONBIEJF_00155 [Fimbriimonadaceae bacterium]|nr:hypothetical protein [Fimbriimonadaceae bacterium]
MKRITLLFVAFAIGLALPSAAWHEDRPPNFKFEPEQSEAEVERLQSKMKVMGEVGGVPDVGERDTTDGMNDSGDTSDLTKASNRKSRESKATEDIRAVERRARGEDSKNRALPIAGIVFAMLGFGAIMAVRQYAGKIAPPIPNRNRKDW